MSVESDVARPPSPRVSVGRRAVAVLLTLVSFTGVGHALLGRWIRGALWSGALALFSMSMPFVGFVGVVAVLVVYLAAVVDVMLVAPPVAGAPARLLALMMAVGVGLGGGVVKGVIRAGVSSPWSTPSGAMEPSLLQGDVFMADASVASPWRRRSLRRGEVLVFDPPREFSGPFVKRIIAVAGDSVRMDAGRLWVNGQPVSRRAIEEACVASSPRSMDIACAVFEETLGEHRYRVQVSDALASFPEREGVCPAQLEPAGSSCRVPAGHLFVLGDNRDFSFDSRHFGAVREDSIRGVGSYIYFSSEPGLRVRWDRVGRWIQ
ncbi:signal peptidase I [Myxococcus sp. MISCRS1]|uniref:signal peptidase I n=1 Tax=Myxococcus sp. MISCRS1 TaxID=2996786 RepID=UPI002270E80E|nr:signal peptidase I [Myxococcus sp. MISCRS1]MCY0997483.1 signal peptidase I [Myxococcus sp. MISCRS1]